MRLTAVCVSLCFLAATAVRRPAHWHWLQLQQGAMARLIALWHPCPDAVCTILCVLQASRSAPCVILHQHTYGTRLAQEYASAQSAMDRTGNSSLPTPTPTLPPPPPRLACRPPFVVPRQDSRDRVYNEKGVADDMLDFLYEFYEGRAGWGGLCWLAQTES